MTKHTADTASTTKKFLAAAGLALGVGSLGLFASAGTAAADEFNILDEDGTWGATDAGEGFDMDWVPAVHSYDTSSYPAESSWPGTTFTGWSPMH